jgi:hypothetical protein
VAAGLPRTDSDTPAGEGLAQLPAGPGAALDEKLGQGAGDLVSAADVGFGSGPAG